MTNGIRTRIYILQVGAIAIFAFCAILLLAGGSFVHGMIHDQLTAQNIMFPAAGTAALNPTEFPDLQQYAGQPVDDGIKAAAYGNGFIGRHLEKVAGGQTYAQVSGKAQANPTDAKLQGQVNTLFKGEMLRGTLLNAYGWWTVGTYAILAGIGLAIATGAILFALLVEIFLAIKARETHKLTAPKKAFAS
ncbi:MAG TPA: hypothetical protein VGR61_07880 [Candidatus Dormibacteraeota bacterium]|nr:hypothetical protein [Candidatus Dormibacteraeota bacterium]